MKKFFTSISVLIIVNYSQAQVQYAGTSVTTEVIDANVLNTTITVPSSAFSTNLIAVAVTEYQHNFQLTVTDVNSQKAFKLATSSTTKNGSLVAIYYLIDAANGTHRIRVSTGAGNNTNIQTVTTVYTGVDVNAPIAYSNSSSNVVAGHLPTLEIPCSTDQLVVDAMIYEASDPTKSTPAPGVNLTYINKNKYNLESSSKTNVSGKLNLSWDYSGEAAGYWGAVALTLQPTRYAIVPGQLVNFSGKAIADKVDLTWITTFETNLNQIAITRSSDNKEWVEVTRVAAAGTSSFQKQYEVADKNVGNGNYYYRLVFISGDGKKSYSSIIAIKSNTEKKLRFGTMPNPFVSDLRVALYTATDKQVLVTVSNSKGITISSKMVAPENGVLNYTVAQSASLSPGVYYIHCTNENETVIKTMLKN
jgi:hypothetical protein